MTAHVVAGVLLVPPGIVTIWALFGAAVMAEEARRCLHPASGRGPSRGLRPRPDLASRCEAVLSD